MDASAPAKRKASFLVRGSALAASLLLALPSAAQDTVMLVGSGSSVPAPLYAKFADAFNRRSPDTQMSYVPLGTSEGIRQISHGSGDFGAGEVPLSAQQRSEGKLLEIPVVLIGIVPIYNVPQLRGDLQFTGEVLAEIFLGHITSWNAPQIERLNPDVKLPNLPIRIVYRPAGKGSNYVFSEFLSKSSPKFRVQIGVTPSPKWPLGVAAERSSDMVDKVRGQPGSIGYVELQYAATAHVSYGRVQNPAGKFVKASPETVTAACHAVEAPGWDKLAASLTNAPGAESFPISSFTWLYLRTENPNARRVLALRELLNWMLGPGQKMADDDGYSELPPPLLQKVKQSIAALH